jgi:hypothetical protein
MARRVLSCALLVFAVGAGVVIEQRTSDHVTGAVTTADDAAISDGSSVVAVVVAARVSGDIDPARHSGFQLRLPAIPTGAAVTYAVVLLGLLAVSAAAPRRMGRRLALVPLRAPPSSRAF